MEKTEFENKIDNSPKDLDITIQTPDHIKLLHSKLDLNSLTIKFQGIMLNLDYLSIELATIQSVETLFLDFSYIFMVGSFLLENLFSKGLNSIKSVKRLHINLNSATQGFLSLKLVEDISNTFPEMLESIHLDFSLCKSFDDKFLDVITNGITQLNNLSSLTFEAPQTAVTSAGVYKFATSMEYMQNLTELVLNFNKCPDLANKALEGLKTGFSNNKKLKTFVLRMMKSEDIDDDGFEFLGQLLLEFKNLENLTLDFTDCPNLTDQALVFLEEAFCDLNKLKKLVLMLTSPDGISDDGFEHFSNGLKNLKKVKTIALAIQFCENLTEKTFDDLGKALVQCSSLESLTLDFESTIGVDDQGLKVLFGSFSGIKALLNISLNFSYCEEITGTGFKNFYESSGSSLLKSIDIKFKGCHNIKAEYISVLGKRIGTLENLADLSLNFNNCTAIKSQSFTDIFESLFSLQNLRDLNLDFAEIPELKKFKIDENKLKEQYKLTSFSLKLSNSGVQDDSILSIFTILARVGLVNLTIDLSNNHDISWQGLEHFMTGLKLMPNLAYLEVNILGCKNLPDNDESLDLKISKILPDAKLVIDE